MDDGHFHSHTRIIKRSAGRSAVAAAAYRAGERLRNDFEGGHSDFTHRQGVLHTEIIGPEGAPDWIFDRVELWNRVEAREKHPRAQLAREVELAMPHHLTHEQNLTLLRQYVAEHFISQGMVADVAIHRGHTDERNIHAHVMLTMRELLPDGFGTKVREWNDISNVLHWREAWARSQNRALKEAGHAVRVDHRSYRQQGIDRRAGIHEGPRGRRMEARGFAPRSKAVRRRSWNGMPLSKQDYRRIDMGRTRAQRNTELRSFNQVRASSGDRMARAVEADVHRWHYRKTLNAACAAGQDLKMAGKQAQRAKRMEGRAEWVLDAHRERVAELLLLRSQIGVPSPALNDYITCRLIKLGQIRELLFARHMRASQAQRQLKRAAVQYRNLKSQLGGMRQAQIQEQVERSHAAALKNVTRLDIWRSALGAKQKHALTQSWARVNVRSR